MLEVKRYRAFFSNEGCGPLWFCVSNLTIVNAFWLFSLHHVWENFSQKNRQRSDVLLFLEIIHPTKVSKSINSVWPQLTSRFKKFHFLRSLHRVDEISSQHRLTSPDQGHAVINHVIAHRSWLISSHYLGPQHHDHTGKDSATWHSRYGTVWQFLVSRLSLFCDINELWSHTCFIHAWISNLYDDLPQEGNVEEEKVWWSSVRVWLREDKIGVLRKRE